MRRQKFRREMVVLDRDGTLVIDHGYCSDPAKLTFLPGVAQGLAEISRAGYQMIVITNQSGVGRGLFQIADVEAANRELCRMVISAGGRIDGILYCPHVPADGCECRKPRAALMYEAAQRWGFDPSQSVVVGDKFSDVQLAINCGARSILLGEPLNDAPIPDHSALTFGAAVELIVGRKVWEKGLIGLHHPPD